MWNKGKSMGQVQHELQQAKWAEAKSLTDLPLELDGNKMTIGDVYIILKTLYRLLLEEGKRRDSRTG
jgi:hypothetical protein